MDPVPSSHAQSTRKELQEEERMWREVGIETRVVEGVFGSPRGQNNPEVLTNFR